MGMKGSASMAGSVSMVSMAGSAGMAVRAGMAAEAAATARNRLRLARCGEIGAVRIRWLEVGPDVVGADPVYAGYAPSD